MRVAAGFAIAFTLAALAIPVIRRLAHRLGAVDRSGVARLGGLAIAIAFFATLLAFGPSAPGGNKLWVILGGGLVMLVLGIFDDVHPTYARTKLAVQVPLAAISWWAGVRIGLPSPALSLAVTVLWIVGVINAINLIDGLDGLAGGLVMAVLLTFGIWAWRYDEIFLLFALLTLAGAIGGFLLYNAHPASIFMGDAGSMFLGYMVAIAAVWSSQKAPTPTASLLPAVALGLPLLDTVLAIWRRLLARQPILRGDHDHLHHRLCARGFSSREAVFLLYGVGLVFGALSLLGFLGLTWPAIVLGSAVGVSLAVWLGYLERPRTSNADREQARATRSAA